jgi:hypothetical protein
MSVLQKDDSCPKCGRELRRKFCDDLPGLHVYIWACDSCKREYGREWSRYHHRFNDPTFVVGPEPSPRPSRHLHLTLETLDGNMQRGSPCSPKMQDNTAM